MADSFAPTDRAHQGWAAPLTLVLALLGCSGPLPKQAELLLDIGPKTVHVHAQLDDLITNGSDPLAGLMAVGSIVTPEALRDLLTESGARRTWLGEVTRYELTERDGKLDLTGAAEASRADFDACLRVGCAKDDPAAKALAERCFLFPLKRCGDHYAIADAYNGYSAAPGAASSWPAAAQQIALQLRLGPSEDQLSALPGFRFYEGNLAGGLAARTWVRDYAKAFLAGDLDRTAALEAQIPKQAPQLRGLLEEQRDRLRAQLLYRVLGKHDPLYLEAPPDAYGADREALDKLVPPKAPPPPALWGLRALQEISRRAPAAFAGRRDEVCGSAPLRAAPEYAKICRLLGASFL
jgi:hypothetical protein